MSKRIISIVVTVLAILILFFGAWIYIGMNGLFWKVSQTEDMSQNYLKEKYPELKYEVGEAHYNSKFGYYYCDVTTKGDMPISFDVIVRGNNTIEDNYYSNKVNTEAKNVVTNLLLNNTPYIRDISVLWDAGPDAIKESYEKSSSFKPGDGCPLKINIIWNGENMPLDTFVDKTLIVRDILKNNKISVSGLSIMDSTNGYVIDLYGRDKEGKTEGSYNFTKEEIIKNNIAYKMKK